MPPNPMLRSGAKAGNEQEQPPRVECKNRWSQVNITISGSAANPTDRPAPFASQIEACLDSSKCSDFKNRRLLAGPSILNRRIDVSFRSRHSASSREAERSEGLAEGLS